MSDDVSDAIESNAQGPKSAMNDGEQVTAHSLREQIEADQYLREKQTRQNKRLGIALRQLKAPGSL